MPYSLKKGFILLFIPILFIELGCQTHPTYRSAFDPIPKAPFGTYVVCRTIDEERRLKTNYNTDAPAGKKWYNILPGTSKVLIVAPHATSAMRSGKWKGPDSGTGSIAILLNQLADCPTIVTVYRSPSDANFYDNNDFKKSLKEMIEKYKPVLVLDLHASHCDRPYDIDYGTMNDQSLLGQHGLLKMVSNHFYNEGLITQSKDYFAAGKNQTVTKFVSALGVPAIQCEINQTWLPNGSDLNCGILSKQSPGQVIQHQRIAKLLQALVRIVRQIEKYLFKPNVKM